MPLVYLAAARYGVAVAIRPGEEPVAVPLAALTRDAVAQEVERLRDAAGRRVQLEATTRWLWSAAMETVIELAGGADRLVLVPTTSLGMLPLHAAWRANEAAVTQRRYACDELAIAYAPNARSVDLAATLDGDELAAITDPEPLPPGHPAITFAGAEIAAALRWIPQAELVTGVHADRATALAALRTGSVHHLACHGRIDLEQPRRSALILAGGVPLTLDDLVDLGLERRREGRLALLTACDTAVAGSELSDEVVSLPAALLQVGFSVVVASQWAVAGLPTALLSARAVEGRSARAGQGAGACAGVGARQHRRRQDGVRGTVAALARGATNALARGRRGGEWRRFAAIADWAAYTYVGTPRRGPS